MQFKFPPILSALLGAAAFAAAFESTAANPFEGARCGPAHGNAICPNDGCCSSEGFCGYTEAHCMTPDCQYEFGQCDSNVTPKGPSTANDPRPLLGEVPYGITIQHCTREKVVALTYDDGPYVYTDELLDLLKKYDFHATFFMSGNSLGKRPIDSEKRSWETIVRMDHEGHQIASHTWSHYNLNELNQTFLLDEMHKNERAIANIVGKYPTYMRAPYTACDGECNVQMRNLGYHIISEDFNTLDWKYPKDIQKSKETVEKLLKKLPENGNALSLQHDIIEDSVKDLSKYLFERIKRKGWRGVTVGECLNDPKENWYRYQGVKKEAAETKAVETKTASKRYIVPPKFGVCTDPRLIYGPGLDGRRKTEYSYMPLNRIEFPIRSSHSIQNITDSICDSIVKRCRAAEEKRTLCRDCQTATIWPESGYDKAKGFNYCLDVDLPCENCSDKTWVPPPHPTRTPPPTPP